MPDHPHSPEQVFDGLWAKARLDKMAAARTSSWMPPFLRELAPGPGRSFLEVGCGTGKISLMLTQAGAQCTLIDLAPNALELATKVYRGEGREAAFCLGDMFHLPFADASFDVVWNTGVLEHFDEAGTAAGLAEMCRVCRPQGKVVAATPSSRALIYRLGKWWRMKKGTWPYGFERPIRTLRKAAPPGWRRVREYQIGTASQVHFWPFRGQRALTTIVGSLAGSEERRPWLGRILGGYLLVSVLQVEDAP
ncbi:MAG TPA: methyltransferase domain-containing protein [bacterium]|nr:methyltransferase domain-containing protein [bacterium]